MQQVYSGRAQTGALGMGMELSPQLCCRDPDDGKTFSHALGDNRSLPI
jgi:hypothetical protein